MKTARALGSDDLDDALLLVRPDGLVLDGNAAVTGLLGTARSVGTNLADHVDETSSRVREILDRQVRSTTPQPAMLQFRGGEGQGRRFTGRRRSATEAEVVIRVRPGSDQFREMTRALDRLNAEIARRVHVESALQEVLGTTVLELEDANQRLRDFADAAAHDLRTPLAVITGLAELLTEDEAPAEGALEASQRIGAAARGCSELVEALHAQAVADADAASGPVDLARELGWVRHLTSEDVLVLEPVTSLPVVSGSRVALRQVLLNLMANAVKHRGPRSSVLVQVSAARRGAVWEILVADDGPGIPAAQRDLALRRGVQLDERRPGSGLGLDLCRTIVERHGGTLDLARSSLGGLAVSFTLPPAT